MLELKYQDKYGNIENVYNAIVDNHEFQMDGRIFEFFCADILLIEGYTNIKVTKASADNGVDIMAEKDGQDYIVQCKCLSHTCSNKAVQEIVSAKTIYKSKKMIVMCNRTFSMSATILANTNKVELYNIGRIRHVLDKYFCEFT
jgi:restriction system protein